jgi:hypothetical protein
VGAPRMPEWRGEKVRINVHFIFMFFKSHAFRRLRLGKHHFQSNKLICFIIYLWLITLNFPFVLYWCKMWPPTLRGKRFILKLVVQVQKLIYNFWELRL